MHAHAAQASLLLFTSQEPLAAVPLTRAPSTCSLGCQYWRVCGWECIALLACLQKRVS